jgi:hypothetical protein
MEEARQRRIELIKQIEQKRKSKVITYFTSDRQNLAVSIASDIIPMFHDHILSFPEKEREKIDLFLYSRGGDSNVPWTLVSMIREYCKKGSFSVLVPFRAHSAATVISLGADEIIMTKKGELGPIDATLSSGPYNPIDESTKNRLPVSVEDVTGYFSLLKRFGCERPDETMEGFKELTKKVHPLALGAVNRTLEETKLVGLRLLATRAKPFTEEKNCDIIKKLSSELYSHGHAITRTEAVQFLGLEQVKEAESQGIDDLMWNLFSEYKQLFDLNVPFSPEEYLIKNNLEEHSWENLNLACIESTEKFHLCKKSIKMRRLRNIPPNVTVNLNQLQMPSVTIQNEPGTIPPQAQQQLIEQVIKANLQNSINSAVASAVDLMIKSLPQRGFENMTFDSGWSEESI